MKPSFRLLLAPLILFACTTGGGGVEYVSIALAATRLVGTFTLASYLFEYGDGARLDPSILKITGNLFIRSDSSYLEGIRVGNDSTPTQGRILKVAAEDGNVDKGILTLDLDQGDSSATGTSRYSFRHDTLIQVTEVSKEQDASKKGFRETKWWTRNP
jgi:hypothetical protein